ncbi:PDR/VanB family oxidoreductase [Actinacidiphila sp. DG2A-62]|uniref:PDR/VanB family oxidoreductase n=1 Tax=Actinacidiphila sp. DG2A-62 TaxID=3108821 RepID=UPI002DB95AE1|nr:PDR/VanB family oxidoreductase [Actinacidiphila sp. DG2A-62]MEC3997099.1 PDR/VanB family oxidoreductase [Actinacidiphila sp. DG2A-62]
MQRTIVETVEPVAEGVVSLLLRGVDGPLAPWEPGAHIDLVLPNWLTRTYSLCGDQDDHDTYQIAVRHDPLSRGGSEYIHLFLRKGRTLDVSLPRNNFPLLPAPEYLFLAGGIGITPLMPMLNAAVESGATASLLYAGRSLATMPFVNELQSGYGRRVRIHSRDTYGTPDLTAEAAALSAEALVYCCGPTAMLDAAEAVFPAERLHVERFRSTVREFAPNAAFEVNCARSARTVHVGEEDSMLDALNHAGFRIPSGCREGVCGSCEIIVTDGEPEHRDDIGASLGRMYCCVSRSLSPTLTIDL